MSTAGTFSFVRKITIVLIIGFMIVLPISSKGQQKIIVSVPAERGNVPEIVNNHRVELVNFDTDHKEYIVDQDQYRLLQEMGFEPRIRCTEEELKSNLVRGKAIDGYKNYNEILSTLEEYVNNYPDICELHDIGNSLGKYYWDLGYSAYEDYQHDIWALKISDNPHLEEDEPCLLYDGGHHAREPIGPAVVMNFAEYLLSNYGTDPDVTDAINENQIWIVPVVNPDGYKLVLDSLEVWWRKTIRDNNENQQIDPFIPDWIEPDGVDPNRNYGIYWGGDWPTAIPYKEPYRGPYSFSEPCTQAIRDLMGDHHFVTQLSYHSYGEKFFYPWSYNPTGYQTPDHALYSSLGTQLALLTPALGSGSYQAMPFGSIVMLTGSTMDYAYGRHGIIIYSVELAQDFIPPPEDIQAVCDAQIGSQMFLTSRVHYSILSGHVTDGISGDPVEAKIVIEGIDNNPGDRYDYKSDERYGRYYRLLNPGEYQVSFSAFGYQPQTHNISISNSGPTILDVSLQAENPMQLEGTIVDETNNPVPNARIIIEDTQTDTLLSDASGNFESYSFYPGQYDFSVLAEGYFICDTTVEVNTQTPGPVFPLRSYDVIDFENGTDQDHFTMWGHVPWSVSTQYAYSGSHSLSVPVLSTYQHASASLELFFETDKLMSLSTRVSLDSITQGMVLILDEEIKKLYTNDLDWQTDTFYIPAGYHKFRWELSRGYQTPGSGFENSCWIDNIIFHDYNTMVREADHDLEALFTVYPNPSAGATTIRISEKVNRVYHAGIYTISGQHICTLQPTNSDYLTWDGTSQSSTPLPMGIYIIRLVSDYGIWSEKLVLK